MNILQWVFIFGVIQIGFLVGCVASEMLPPSEQTEFDLKVDWSESPEKELPAGYTTSGKLSGFSQQGIGWCNITAQKPSGEADTDRLLTLGHEVFHCTDGDYHPDTKTITETKDVQ